MTKPLSFLSLLQKDEKSTPLAVILSVSEISKEFNILFKFIDTSDFALSMID